MAPVGKSNDEIKCVHYIDFYIVFFLWSLFTLHFIIAHDQSPLCFYCFPGRLQKLGIETLKLHSTRMLTFAKASCG